VISHPLIVAWNSWVIVDNYVARHYHNGGPVLSKNLGIKHYYSTSKMELQLLMSSNKASTSICYTSLALLCAKDMRQLLIQSSVQIRPHICLHAKHAMKVLEFWRKTPLALVETNCHRKNTLNKHCEAS
jgi:hypothetical protein